MSGCKAPVIKQCINGDMAHFTTRALLVADEEDTMIIDYITIKI